MSPAWMMYPLQRYLRRRGDAASRWDYPRVFSNLDRVVDSLAFKLDEHADGSVAIVAHSFGAWIARSALNRTQGGSVAKLVSICPVVKAVPLVRLGKRFLQNKAPEFRVMSDDKLSSITIPPHLSIERSYVWAKWDIVISKPEEHDSDLAAWGTHNSLLFQPNIWKHVYDELSHS